MYFVEQQLEDIKVAVLRFGDDFESIQRVTGFTPDQVRYRLKKAGLHDLIPHGFMGQRVIEAKAMRDSNKADHLARQAYFDIHWDQYE